MYLGKLIMILLQNILEYSLIILKRLIEFRNGKVQHLIQELYLIPITTEIKFLWHKVKKYL